MLAAQIIVVGESGAFETDAGYAHCVEPGGFDLPYIFNFYCGDDKVVKFIRVANGFANLVNAGPGAVEIKDASGDTLVLNPHFSIMICCPMNETITVREHKNGD